MTPEEIERMTAGLLQLYSDIEDDLLTNVARRFSVADEITPDTVAQWQTDKLLQTAALRRENIKALAARSGKTEAEITRILTEAGYSALALDEAIYKTAFSSGLLSKVPVPAKASPAVQAALKGALDNTREYFNLINTTALESAQQGFLDIINQTYLETSLGITDYNSAVRKAVMQLADKGITGAHYISEAGRRTSNHIDVAVRRCIVTSTAQTAGNMQIARAGDWGAEYVEVTSHMGARPEHAVWQGKIFRINGRDAQHENLASATGYGTVRGLCGANCRHTFYPFFEGISEQTYKPYDLAENKKAYDESQVQRQLERDVRAQKRRVLAADADGDAEALQKAQLKLKEKEAKLKAYTQQTGRYQRTNRQQVYGFDRSQASRAAWTKRKAGDLKAPAKSGIIGGGNPPDTIAGVKIGKPMTFEKADEGRSNPNYLSGGGYRTNCQSCVVCHEARLRGYVVETLPETPGSALEILSSHTNTAWVDRITGSVPNEIKISSALDATSCYKYLDATLKPGERYTLSFSWKGRTRSGHIVCVEKLGDGTTRMFDPQCGKTYTKRDLWEYLKSVSYKKTSHGLIIPTPPRLLRVDDKDFNFPVVNQILKGATE